MFRFASHAINFVIRIPNLLLLRKEDYKLKKIKFMKDYPIIYDNDDIVIICKNHNKSLKTKNEHSNNEMFTFNRNGNVTQF